MKTTRKPIHRMGFFLCLDARLKLADRSPKVVDGLTQAEAAKRLTADGANTVSDVADRWESLQCPPGTESTCEDHSYEQHRERDAGVRRAPSSSRV